MELLGTISRSGLAGIQEALLEDLCHLGWALTFQKLLSPSASISLSLTLSPLFFLLSMSEDTKLSATALGLNLSDDHGLTL